MLTAIIFVVFPFAMAYALLTDLFSMTIANRVSMILLGTFAIVAPLSGMEWMTYLQHFGTGALVLVITFGLFAVGGMGGGDAKLMAVTAVWFGWNPALVEYFLIASLLGGLLTMAILMYRNSNLPVFVGNVNFLHRMAQKNEGIPYGIALGSAGLIVAPQMPLMKSAIEALV